MRFIYLLLSVAILLLCLSCGNDVEQSKSFSSLPVENTPEAVARYWLENYFDNQFEVAKAYSTPATQAMIDTIQSILFTETEEKILFKITALQCAVEQDKALCTYVYEEASEKIPESIELKKQAGKWLVNAQLVEEDALEESIDMEALIKELEKE